MTFKHLVLTIGIVFFLFTLNIALAEEDARVGEEIQEAITMFVGGSSRERVEAAKALSEFDLNDLTAYGAWKLFTKVLRQDDSPRVQKAVVTALGKQSKNTNKYPSVKVIDLLFATIKNESLHSVVRTEAVLVIGLLMPDDSDRVFIGEYLEKQLDSKESNLLKAIMKTLTLWKWDLGDRISKNIVDIINDDPELRGQAIRAMKKQIVLKNFKIEPLQAKRLLDIINNEQKDKDIRIDLINLLAIAVKNGSKIPAMTDALDKIINGRGDNQVVSTAVDAIGRTNDPNLIKLLIRVYNEHKESIEPESVAIRSTACAAATDFFALFAKREGYLTRYRSDFENLSSMLLEALLRDGSNIVRKEAANSFGSLTSRKVDRSKPVAALIDTVATADESIVEASLESLSFITHQDFGKNIEAWHEWFKTNQSYLTAR